jgi:hypothetical protein
VLALHCVGLREPASLAMERFAVTKTSHPSTSPGAAILETPLSDRDTLGGVTQFTIFLLSRDCKSLILKGEMSEWLKAHAWKTIPASRIERYGNISSRNRFNDFPLQDAS